MSGMSEFEAFDKRCIRIWKSILIGDFSVAKEDFGTLIGDYVKQEEFVSRLYKFRVLLGTVHGAHCLRQLVMKDPFAQGRNLSLSIPEAKTIPRGENFEKFPCKLIETMIEILDETIAEDDTRLIGFYLGLGSFCAYGHEFAIAETLYSNAFRLSMNLKLPDIVEVIEHVRMRFGLWGFVHGADLAKEIRAFLFCVTMIDHLNSWYQDLSEEQQPWWHAGEPARCRINLVWSFYSSIVSCIERREYSLAAMVFSQAISNLRKIPDVLLFFFRWYPEITEKGDYADCIRHWRRRDPFDPTIPLDSLQRETLLKYFFEFQLVAWRGQFIHHEDLAAKIEKVAGSSIKESLVNIASSVSERGFETVTLSPGEFRSWTQKFYKRIIDPTAVPFSASLPSEELALTQIKNYILERWSWTKKTPRVIIGVDIRAYRMIRVHAIESPNAFDDYFTPELARHLIEIIHSLNGNPLLDSIVPPGDGFVLGRAIMIE